MVASVDEAQAIGAAVIVAAGAIVAVAGLMFVAVAGCGRAVAQKAAAFSLAALCAMALVSFAVAAGAGFHLSRPRSSNTEL